MAMTKTRNQPQQRQLPPGALFRVPGLTARPRFVEEPGPCQPATSITLSQGASTNAPFLKFQTLDIDRAFLLELDFTTTWTAGSGKTLTVSPFSIMAWIQSLQVQFESAYSTFRLPGFLALPMQMYRSNFSPTNMDSMVRQGGANPAPANQLYNGEVGTAPLSTANLALNVSTSGTQQTYKMFLEVPVSMYFDLYWELGATGQPQGSPTPRCIVSPQRMAATTRNVTPKLTLGPGLSSQPTNAVQSGPASLASGDTTSTFSGSAVATWFRDCWIPSKNPLTEPPGRMWQYSRDFIAFQTAGAGQVAIPIDDEVPGQGQILSMIGVVYDPALNSSIGGVTPYSAISLVELLYGSQVQIFQDTVQSNLYRWLMQHGSVLPAGFFGWDMALTEDGRLTNEFAINTLVTAGTQARLTFASGSVPGSTATVYIGLEMLKKVGS